MAPIAHPSRSMRITCRPHSPETAPSDWGVESRLQSSTLVGVVASGGRDGQAAKRSKIEKSEIHTLEGHAVWMSHFFIAGMGYGGHADSVPDERHWRPVRPGPADPLAPRCWRGHQSRDCGLRMVVIAVSKPNLDSRCRFRPLELPKKKPRWRSEPISKRTNVMARGTTTACMQVLPVPMI